MTAFEHIQNIKNLEGSFRVEGIVLSDDTKKNLGMLAAQKITADELLSQIILKYKAAGA